jgi:hypothetical protein
MPYQPLATHGPELAASLDEILALMGRLHAESLDIFCKLGAMTSSANAATLAAPKLPPGNGYAMTEREIHHCGQLYLYLGILGVPTPPLSDLTSEQVRGRSQS